MEQWKPVPGYEGLYEVSNYGRVRSLFRYKKILTTSPNKGNGYLYAQLFKDKKPKNYAVHRLVAVCFCENPENKPFVNHKDETRTNNHADNLEWVTHKENCNYGTAIARRSAHTDYKNRRINNKHQIEVASRPVIQCDVNGIPIKEWSSITECAKAIGMSPSGVSSSLHRRGTTRNGYKFMEVMKNV